MDGQGIPWLTTPAGDFLAHLTTLTILWTRRRNSDQRSFSVLELTF
jgi:hypothetical protein